MFILLKFNKQNYCYLDSQAYVILTLCQPQIEKSCKADWENEF